MTAHAGMLRDPAWTRRWLGLSIAVVILWPLFLITEFQPGRLLGSESLLEMGRFLESFLPPRIDPDFLLLVVTAAWKTVAMATAGLCLALLAAIPMALLITERLSIGATEGRMHPLARLARTLLRGVMAVLRSVPELVWALMFVRVVGLGPTAGVLAIAITYSGMLGKVYAEILESGPLRPPRPSCKMGLADSRRWPTDCCPRTPPNSPPTRSIAWSVQFAHRLSWALLGRAASDRS